MIPRYGCAAQHIIRPTTPNMLWLLSNDDWLFSDKNGLIHYQTGITQPKIQQQHWSQLVTGANGVRTNVKKNSAGVARRKGK